MENTGSACTQYFPSSISAKYFLLLAVPVIKTPHDGIITNVEMDFMLPDGTPVDYSRYITTLVIQFKDTQGMTTHQEGSIFDLMNKLPNFENVSITKRMNINEITGISINYTILWEIYGINWDKQ